MSVQSEITRIKNARDAISNAITEKGVAVPENTVIEDIPGFISKISSGRTFQLRDSKTFSSGNSFSLGSTLSTSPEFHDFVLVITGKLTSSTSTALGSIYKKDKNSSIGFGELLAIDQSQNLLPSDETGSCIIVFVAGAVFVFGNNGIATIRTNNWTEEDASEITIRTIFGTLGLESGTKADLYAAI